MGISIDKTRASAVLRRAIEIAESSADLPEYWTRLTRAIDEGPVTYMPALGTALLAKATDDRIDPLSIKSNFSGRSYSLRTVGHEVLVPASKDESHGFDLKAQGREPLNNQPFFRYDHITMIDRVRNRAQFSILVDGLSSIDPLDADEALLGLAAFVRERQHVRRSRPSYDLSDARATAREIATTGQRYLRPGVDDLPARAQAVAAGVVQCAYPSNVVTTGKLHDPSRHAPGDVVVWADSVPLRSLEVRTKPVSFADAASFVDACAAAGISAAGIVVASALGHVPLDRTEISGRGLRAGVTVTVNEDILELVNEAMSWSIADLSHFQEGFADAVMTFLAEVGADGPSLAEWEGLWPKS